MPPKSKVFWEGNYGVKINHLVRWNLAIKAQLEGSLRIGGLKYKHLPLISKWGWRFIHEPDYFCPAHVDGPLLEGFCVGDNRKLK